VVELGPALADELEASDRYTMLGVSIAIRALRGEPVAGLLADLTGLVGASTDPTPLSSLEATKALEAFATGRLADARVAWLRVAELSANNLPVSLARAARSALWLRDAAAARADLDALDASGVHGRAVEADRATIRAGIASLDGRPADAVASYRDALRSWRDLGLAWDEALAGIDMALLLDPTDPFVRAAGEGAREILFRLEAAPFIARLDAALARPADHAGRASVQSAASVSTS
jgi:tetratricopeptide (TPR) repeat protein